MKRFLTVFCAIAFVGAVLSSCGAREKCPAFSKVDKVSSNNS